MMRMDARSNYWLAACMFAFAGAFGAGTAIAQDAAPPPSPIIAVIDVQLVLRQAAAQTSNRQQIDNF